MSEIEVTAIPAFTDNYIWLITTGGNSCAVVDPGDAQPTLKLEFRVLEIPGHTSSHIAFFGHGCLFCGDTLFSVGCGRLFEGNPACRQAPGPWP